MLFVARRYVQSIWYLYDKILCLSKVLVCRVVVNNPRRSHTHADVCKESEVYTLALSVTDTFV
jgi:hypothetical protein